MSNPAVDQRQSPERKRPSRFAALRNKLADLAILGTGVVVGAGVTAENESLRYLVHNLVQVIQENPDHVVLGGVATVAIAGLVGAGMGISKLKERKTRREREEERELPVELLLYKHPAWRRRDGESEEAYTKRTNELKEVVQTRLFNSLPGVNIPSLRARVEKMKVNNKIDEHLEELGVDSRFLDTVDAFKGDSDGINHILGPVEEEISRNKSKRNESKKRPTIKRAVLRSIAVLAISAAALPFMQGSIANTSREEPAPRYSMSAQDDPSVAPIPSTPTPTSRPTPTESATTETEAPESALERKYAAAREALHNAQPDEEIGAVGGVSDIDNRKVKVNQGYASNGDPNDPEADINSGFDYRLINASSGHFSNAAHYNQSTTKYDGTELAKPIMPGDPGVTAFAAHNGSWVGGEGGFNRLEEVYNAKMGTDNNTFTFESGDVTFVYKFIDKIEMPRKPTGDPSTNVFNNNITPPEWGVGSFLVLQACPEKPAKNVIGYVGKLKYLIIDGHRIEIEIIDQSSPASQFSRGLLPA
jgi:hypothetical protein